MTPQQEPEREEKREGIVGEICEGGLEIVDGVLDIGGAIAESTSSILGGAAEMAGGAIEAMGSAAGEATSGCAGCAPVIALAFILPIGIAIGQYVG